MGRFKSNVLAQRPWHRPPRDSLDQDGRLSGSLAAFKFAISAGFEKNNIRDSFRKAFARRPILLFQKMRGWLSLDTDTGLYWREWLKMHGIAPHTNRWGLHKYKRSPLLRGLIIYIRGDEYVFSSRLGL